MIFNDYNNGKMSCLNCFKCSMRFYSFVQSSLRLILGLLGVVGFSGCGAMYGTPSADFEMKGKVVNEEGESLTDVKVITADIEHDSLIYGRVVSITNEAGNYRVSEDLYNLRENNGGYSFRFMGDTTRYEPFDTIIMEKQLHFEDEDGWYKGRTSVTMNVTLKSKERK